MKRRDHGSGVAAAGTRAAGSGTGPAHAGASRCVLGGLDAPGHLPGPASGSSPARFGEWPQGAVVLLAPVALAPEIKFVLMAIAAVAACYLAG